MLSHPRFEVPSKMRVPTLGLIAIVVISLLLRVGMGSYLDDKLTGLPGTADQLSYHTLAARLLDGHGFSFDRAWWPATEADAQTGMWSFLYTYFIAGVYAVFGSYPLMARIVQSLIVGILHPVLAYFLGRRLGGEAVGVAAAGVTAIYVYFVYYSASLMTEGFYITGILASLYLSIELAERIRKPEGSSAALRNCSLGLGIALGMTVLFRQVFLLFIPVLLTWVWWVGGRRSLVAVGVSSAIVAIMVLPFTAFNYVRFDRFVLLNTNSGYAFYWANHPIYGTQFEPILPDEMGSYQALIPDDLRSLDEAALDQELLKRGLGFVAADPLRYLKLSLSRIPIYFMFWPSAESRVISNLARTLSFGLFLPFMIYGLVRSWIHHGATALRRPVGLLTLFVVVYSAIHLLSWSLIRYRLPVDAVLVIFAGLALVDLAQHIKSMRRTGIKPTWLRYS